MDIFFLGKRKWVGLTVRGEAKSKTNWRGTSTPTPPPPRYLYIFSQSIIVITLFSFSSLLPTTTYLPFSIIQIIIGIAFFFIHSLEEHAGSIEEKKSRAIYNTIINHPNLLSLEALLLVPIRSYPSLLFSFLFFVVYFQIKSRIMSGRRGGGKPPGLPAIRTRVGKYELGKTLGEGSFAKVKFAKNVETGDNVAIKIVDKEQVLRNKMVEQMKTEISTMKLINHPNVLKLYEVMASKTKIYIVLEFVDGGELFDKIVNNGSLKEDDARRYFQQLINAVDYCHSRGVYHRDLKPENLLLDSHGTLKVSDFGLSALSQQIRGDGLLHTACGTPNYVAPEVLDDQGYDGTSADVWSCGVILFVLMAGYLPFDEPNLMVLYKKINKASYKCPPWFSSNVKKLLKCILDPNPRTRITISEILENEWFKKGYRAPNFEEVQDISVDDVKAVFSNSKDCLVTEKKEKPASLNAFELISRSQCFDLGNLFEKQPGLVKRETSFTSQRPANEILSKIEETAKPLGFNVHKHNYKMKLKGDKTGRKGHLSVATEVFEVAPSLHVVELRKTGGDTLEFHKFYKSFSSGLKDIVWKSDAIPEGKRS